jgi:hypothetical protein
MHEALPADAGGAFFCPRAAAMSGFFREIR